MKSLTSLALRPLGLAALLASACLAHAASTPALPDEICHHDAASPDGAASAPRPMAVQLPAVVLQSARAAAAPISQRIRTADAVLLNFIFTSCTSVCPPMSQTFAATQERLGSRASQLQLVSISIDPEHDTPKRLQAYAQRFGAGPQWTFHTGTQASVDAVQRAFQVYRPDKMGHTPVTFVKPRGQDNWLRVDGLARPEQLMALALGSAAR
jgi:protein SCO1/2